MINVFILTTIIFIAFVLIALFRTQKKNLKILNNQIDNLREEIDLLTQQKLETEYSLESRTALLTDVSHELRSPLHGIISLSETLSTKWNELEDSNKHKFIGSIFDASVGLIKLVNNLLDFSKFDAGKMVFNFGKLNLVEQIEEIINYCKNVYLFDNKVIINFDRENFKEAFILGDNERINQLINNLVVNAIKHTDSGSIDAKLELVNDKDNTYWKFILIDSGTGILSQDLDNIFKSFIQGSLTSSNIQAGSGLGLAICKQIVEAHKGKIWAENNQNGGAKFNFIIPAFDDA